MTFYQNSRDAAWEILLRHNICSLPVDVWQICRTEKIHLVTYANASHIIERMGIAEELEDNDAFSVGNVIMYDDSKPVSRQRFSIAHELGHIFLHTQFGRKRRNVEEFSKDALIETEANIFASRLLAPLGVLQFLNLNSADEISKICDIGYTSAKYRYSRLCNIRKKNSNRKKQIGHGTFLISPLERKVIKNFEKYIEENKKL